MLVLSYGITKSGSTLAFELAKAVLEGAGYEQARLSDCVVSPGHHINFITKLEPEAIEALICEIGENRKIVVKVHTAIPDLMFPILQQYIRSGDLLVHVCCRDPREICLSLLDAGEQARAKNNKAFSEIVTMDDAIRACSNQLQSMRRWGALPDVLMLYYNDVAFETDRAIAAVNSQFGTSTPAEYIKRQIFERAFTQKNRAIKDRYKHDLTSSQNAALLAKYENFISQVCNERDMGWFEAS